MELAGNRPLSKLFAFKLLVGLNILMNVSSLRVVRTTPSGATSLISKHGLTLSQIIFWILNGINPSPLTPSSTMNQADVSVGIPAMVNCLILVPFSVFFHYAYSVGPYIVDRHRGPERGESRYLDYQGGFLGVRAFLGMVNPSEILGAIAFMFTMRRRRNKSAARHGSGRGYDTVTSHESRNAGQAHEMRRHEQRRLDKQGRSQHPRGYETGMGENAPYGWTNHQVNGNGRYHVASEGR